MIITGYCADVILHLVETIIYLVCVMYFISYIRKSVPSSYIPALAWYTVVFFFLLYIFFGGGVRLHSTRDFFLGEIILLASAPWAKPVCAASGEPLLALKVALTKLKQTYTVSRWSSPLNDFSWNAFLQSCLMHEVEVRKGPLRGRDCAIGKLTFFLALLSTDCSSVTLPGIISSLHNLYFKAPGYFFLKEWLLF